MSIQISTRTLYWLAAILVLAQPASAFIGLEQVVGGLLYRDKNLSDPPGQSCMTCHHPSAGWADPANAKDPANLVVSEGVIPGEFGGRNAPTASYAAFSPEFHWDAAQELYIGGLFWDGRATGQGPAGTPLGDQALGPFLNPVEMNNTMDGVVAAVRDSGYAWLFELAYPGTDWTDVGGTYIKIGQAIGKFEETRLLNKFTSKYDRYLAGQASLSRKELRGLRLFNNPAKGNCAACHPSDVATDGTPPLFTDFSYDNLGIPKSTNALIAGNDPDLGLGALNPDTSPVNPLVDPCVDLLDPGCIVLQEGKFKVSTLRNIARTAPYGHNGYFATLKEIVHFYNTRDVPGAGWDAPEVVDNVNTTELGDLGLTDAEENAIVAFLKTLTDGR